MNKVTKRWQQKKTACSPEQAVFFIVDKYPTIHNRCFSAGYAQFIPLDTHAE